MLMPCETFGWCPQMYTCQSHTYLFSGVILIESPSALEITMLKHMTTPRMYSGEESQYGSLLYLNYMNYQEVKEDCSISSIRQQLHKRRHGTLATGKEGNFEYTKGQILTWFNSCFLNLQILGHIFWHDQTGMPTWQLKHNIRLWGRIIFTLKSSTIFLL